MRTAHFSPLSFAVQLILVLTLISLQITYKHTFKFKRLILKVVYKYIDA